MKIDRERFLQEGYLVVREVVPEQRLASLRAESELLVERQKVRWVAERGADDPPGGVWETSAQPRLQLGATSGLVDAATAGFIQFWLHENTLGVSRELLQMPQAAVTEMMMMCNPVGDRGPAAWHRDIHPFDTAPLQGYIDDIAENGPRYVQWNIPLYDDDVLWVVSGSHLRLNTEEEQRQLHQDPRVPLPNAVQTQLRAGDAVVYITPILHWGSNYSAKLRRTLHGGYSPFTAYGDLSFSAHLSDAAREAFASFEQQSARAQDLTEAVLRAALGGHGYRDGLEALQPGLGDRGKWLLTVYLCKAAGYIHALKNPQAGDVAQSLHASARNKHPTTLNWGPSFAERFTPTEAAALWRRFAGLDAALQTAEHHVAGFQGGPVPYHFNQLPADLDLDALVESWAEKI
jgi:hypothetical protein